MLNLEVTITKTSTLTHDYIQIMSDDQVTINVVFVADKIVVKDTRPIIPSPNYNPEPPNKND